MVLLQNFSMANSVSPFCAVNTRPILISFRNSLFPQLQQYSRTPKSLSCLAVSMNSDPEPSSKPSGKPRRRKSQQKLQLPEIKDEDPGSDKMFPRTIPKKKKRGRKRKKKMVVEEEDPYWPLDADIGWGVRASEYFEQHPIRNVVGEDGFEIDWEGEIDDNWVKEINCLEWESFAFHPSPLVVLVFERYNRATDNWKSLKELEKAIKVYWNAKDRLPPRAVKLDINIERDLAYALKVKECPQILFLLGNRIMYREKEFRTADELVQMIAHFYYKAKRPSWVDKAAFYPAC
ncbi:Thioredoxin-like protein [Melia azedarach]|uniref:Thioredoxin-like protein n=1 Tax=Melia azedarach TaxID=155640 RepID=A0ACC1YTA6_MELAZ|nr:Thioredoxin-like protein [Melia azedarach]